MNHGVDIPGVAEARAHSAAGRGWLPRAMAAINSAMVVIGMITLLIASCVLTYSVFSRYLFKAATDWQDEVAVFSIICAVFLSGAWVQSQRGHVGIEALASV